MRCWVLLKDFMLREVRMDITLQLFSCLQNVDKPSHDLCYGYCGDTAGGRQITLSFQLIRL